METVIKNAHSYEAERVWREKGEKMILDSLTAQFVFVFIKYFLYNFRYMLI
jgi:hypothetical protein